MARSRAMTPTDPKVPQMRVTRAFTNRRFRTKLMVAFLTVAVLGAICGGFGLVVQGRITTALDRSYSDSLLPVVSLDQAQLAAMDSMSKTIQALGSSDDLRDYAK